MSSLVFIALQLSQPRCIKRIETMIDAGVKVKVYGFDSGLYNDSLKNLSFPVEKIIKRDKTSGRIKKICFFIRCIKKILKENSSNDVFYLFGYEIASIAWLLRCKQFIYEEADVTAARTHCRLIRFLLLAIDRRIIKESKLTVFTSQGFSDYLFKKKPKNVIIQPNKLSPFFSKLERGDVLAPTTDASHIKFGFVGLIRYPDTLIRFAKVVGQYFPQHEFHFYGALEKEKYWDEEITTYENIYSHGSFVYPNELQNIYKNIDICVVCYDTHSGNVRIAEPNKLYEAIYFKIPIVVSSSTFLAKRVKELGVGFDIDASKDECICKFIKEINIGKLEKVRKSMHNIPTQDLIDNSLLLVEKITDILH